VNEEALAHWGLLRKKKKTQTKKCMKRQRPSDLFSASDKFVALIISGNYNLVVTSRELGMSVKNSFSN
jgi:mRNA-degrading endonuclease HigB of HigAB toxin-antitoxin module